LLFKLIKYPAKIALHLYCKKIVISNPALLNINGPVLIAANHPNSFLDAIILSTIFKQPIYSLTRGDAFKKKGASSILYALNMLPVYRLSEGVDNINCNYHTFKNCLHIFKKKGIVLIFSEGICINEWHLKPLKKGTARLALIAWQQNIPLTILPVGINYNNFYRFIKNVHIHIGNGITATNFNLNNTEGNNIKAINNSIYQALSPLVYELSATNKQAITQKFSTLPFSNNIAGKLFGLFGYYLHLPFYKLIKYIVSKFLKDNDHFDSMIIGITFLSYPIYILLVCSIVSFFCTLPCFLLPIFLMPLSAWMYIQTKQYSY
jgi:1-acyl-sn-glycerol-3-phosphate acyltransferase